MSFISAKVIADSISTEGIRITTFELEFPRIILAEFNTHRLFSRNAASTRAIPLNRQLEYLVNRYFEPSPFTKNKPGMVSNEPVDDQEKSSIEWKKALSNTIEVVKNLDLLGVAKQHAGRLLEPFTHIKVVCTATEYDNFFWLRCHPDAQPEIQELANQMWEARENSIPVELNPDEWHVPYYKNGQWKPFMEKSNVDHPEQGTGFTLQDAIAISASCCAQVSYRRLDDSLDKAREIYNKLLGETPHFSPFEHQSTPMGHSSNEMYGVTHTDVYGNKWSGNFKNWIQHRQTLYDMYNLKFMTSSKNP